MHVYLAQKHSSLCNFTINIFEFKSWNCNCLTVLSSCAMDVREAPIRYPTFTGQCLFQQTWTDIRMFMKIEWQARPNLMVLIIGGVCVHCACGINITLFVLNLSGVFPPSLSPSGASGRRPWLTWPDCIGKPCPGRYNILCVNAWMLCTCISCTV